MITTNTDKEPDYGVYIAGTDPIQVTGIQSSLGELYIYKGDTTQVDVTRLTQGTCICTGGSTICDC